jgi:hypothetical protein
MAVVVGEVSMTKVVLFARVDHSFRLHRPRGARLHSDKRQPMHHDDDEEEKEGGMLTAVYVPRIDTYRQHAFPWPGEGFQVSDGAHPTWAHGDKEGRGKSPLAASWNVRPPAPWPNAAVTAQDDGAVVGNTHPTSPPVYAIAAAARETLVWAPQSINGHDRSVHRPPLVLTTTAETRRNETTEMPTHELPI